MHQVKIIEEFSQSCSSDFFEHNTQHVRQLNFPNAYVHKELDGVDQYPHGLKSLAESKTHDDLPKGDWETDSSCFFCHFYDLLEPRQRQLGLDIDLVWKLVRGKRVLSFNIHDHAWFEKLHVQTIRLWNIWWDACWIAKLYLDWDAKFIHAFKFVAFNWLVKFNLRVRLVYHSKCNKLFHCNFFILFSL